LKKYNKELLIAILAGGKSRRIGTHKYLLPSENPLIKVIIERIYNDKVFDIVLIVKNPEQISTISSILHGYKDIVYIPDISIRKHVIVGVLTATVYALYRGFEYMCVLGSDMPLISLKFLEFMFKVIKRGYDAVVPRWRNGFIEPLASVYKVSKLYEAIVDTLLTMHLDRCSLRSVIKRLELAGRVLYISAELICSLFGYVFYNINTVQDLEVLKFVKMSVRGKT